MPSRVAVAAVASLYARDRPLVDRAFDHMTHDELRSIDEQLLQDYNKVLSTRCDSSAQEGMSVPQKRQDCYKALGQAFIRRTAYRSLDKYAKLLSSRDIVEDALKYYTLPDELQQTLATKFGAASRTWYEALDQLKEMATSTSGTLNQGKLWRLVLEHPMTAYVPVQCPKCGHVVRDEYPLQQSDEEVGIKEVPPTGEELDLRAGWYRGPRKAVVFEITCLDCGFISKWYRSGHPKILLNPNKWGRLCGDQEDLRLILADYLKIPVRYIRPLDWDHCWSEYQTSSMSNDWDVHDGSARNFCRRLDEGIGSWTRVWAIHPDFCEDVTQKYLKYKKNGGRADDRHDEEIDDMIRYEKIVKDAQNDGTGELTQAKTCNGYILARGNYTDEEITEELQRAAKEYKDKEWWQLHA